MDGAVDHGTYMSFFLSEMIEPEFNSTVAETPLFPVVPVTDCKSLFAAVISEDIKTPSEKEPSFIVNGFVILLIMAFWC